MTQNDLAIQALDRIAQHEKECGERWAEAVVELRELKKATEAPCYALGKTCLACCCCCSNKCSHDSNNSNSLERI